MTNVNGGRMKAEWFLCLTEHLISLNWVFGRTAERGTEKYLSAVMLVAVIIIILLTFICLGLLNVCVVVHRCSAYINSAFTHIHIWITDQLLVPCTRAPWPRQWSRGRACAEYEQLPWESDFIANHIKKDYNLIWVMSQILPLFSTVSPFSSSTVSSNNFFFCDFFCDWDLN